MDALWINCSPTEKNQLLDPLLPEHSAISIPLAELKQTSLADRPCAVVIGSEDRRPLNTARSAHQTLPDSTLIFLYDDAGHKQDLEGQLQLAPSLGRAINFCDNHSVDEVKQALGQAKARYQRTKRFRQLIGGANMALTAKAAPPAQHRHFLDQLLENAPIGLVTLNAQQQVHGYNAVAKKLLDINGHRSLWEYLPEDSKHVIRQHLNDNDGAEILVSTKSKHLSIRGSQLLNQGQQTHLLTIEDLTARVDAEQALTQLNETLEARVQERTAELQAANEAMLRASQYDAATDLFNRHHFTQILGATLSSKPKDGNQHCLLYLDLDGFKAINDCYGHAIGDDAIKQIAAILSEKVGVAGSVSRHGGDEFLILLPDCPPHTGTELAEQILDTLRHEPLTFGSLIVTASIGLALYPSHADSSAELLRAADAAMYLAKQDGRNQLYSYTPDIRIKQRDRAQLAQELRHAVANKTLSVHYQPQYRSTQGQLVGAEALSRWTLPDGRTVPPAEFIDIAEETGQILALGREITDIALKDLTAWVNQGLVPKNFKLAINMSVLQVIAEQFLDDLFAQINQHPEITSHIELELTENVLVRDFQQASRVINRLRNAGFRVALDDFGTAHSGLSYLAKLPVDTVKIDRHFIESCTNNPRYAAVIESIIQLCDKLGTNVVAEGVETAEQVQLLESLGKPLYQGFYFSAAVPADEFSKLLASQRTNLAE